MPSFKDIVRIGEGVTKKTGSAVKEATEKVLQNATKEVSKNAFGFTRGTYNYARSEVSSFLTDELKIEASKANSVLNNVFSKDFGSSFKQVWSNENPDILDGALSTIKKDIKDSLSSAAEGEITDTAKFAENKLGYFFRTPTESGWGKAKNFFAETNVGNAQSNRDFFQKAFQNSATQDVIDLTNSGNSIKASAKPINSPTTYTGNQIIATGRPEGINFKTKGSPYGGPAGNTNARRRWSNTNDVIDADIVENGNMPVVVKNNLPDIIDAEVVKEVPKPPINNDSPWASPMRAALGTAVAGGALMAALSSSRGQQNNAQLYGQQPLY